MKKITPFLWFDGQAAQAAKFYVSIFENSKILSVSRQGKGVMSVTFRLDGQDFIALNGGPHYKLTPAVSFFINCKTQQEVDGFWKKLIKGGKPSRCGWLEDQFGLSWQVVPEQLRKMLSDKDPAKAGRVMQAMMQMVKLDLKALKKAYDAV